MTWNETRRMYRKIIEAGDLPVMRHLALTDLFFLLVVVLGRHDADREWIMARCREVEAMPDGCIDLWAREHYKSTIITFALTIQSILKDPEITIGIFSITRTNSKKALKQIKQEFERNALLKQLFPDVLYQRPQKEAAKWTDDFLTVRRKGNPKESTLEAWGFDSMPTGAHFKLMVYDDAIDQDGCTTPEMMKKIISLWELSIPLGADGGSIRYIGTRYHANDLYGEILRRKCAVPRIYPATDTGRADGRPVFLDDERWAKIRLTMGAYTLACQYLQNPKEDGAMGFKADWLRFYPTGDHPPRASMNVYITVDAAKGLKAKNDYTSMWVWGLAPDNNRYILDGYRGRLNLGDRVDKLFSLVHRWRPNGVGYEEDSAQADIDAINLKMKERHWRFNIIPIPTHGVNKVSRILRLQPDFQNGRIWLPDRLMFVDHQGETRDLVNDFRYEEYDMFPVCQHDDMIDNLSNIYAPELGAAFPAYRGPCDADGGKTNNTWKPF